MRACILRARAGWHGLRTPRFCVPPPCHHSLIRHGSRARRQGTAWRHFLRIFGRRHLLAEKRFYQLVCLVVPHPPILYHPRTHTMPPTAGIRQWYSGWHAIMCNMVWGSTVWFDDLLPTIPGSSFYSLPFNGRRSLVSSPCLPVLLLANILYTLVHLSIISLSG